MKQNNESVSENPFWDFSQRFYAQNSVASSCIELQEMVGADVNILLYCCWVASEGAVVIEPTEFAEIIKTTGPWQSYVVHGLRQVRSDMKRKKSLYLGKLSEDLRQSIKRCELEGERLEQMILYLSGHKPFSGDREEKSVRINNAKINLKNYVEIISADMLEATENLIQIISNDLIIMIEAQK